MTQLLQDILNEPAELRKGLAYTLGPGRATLDHAAQLVRAARHVYITGIGSSWHAGMAVQSMRSATYLQKGERLVCQGCHEPKHRAPLPDGRGSDT